MTETELKAINKHLDEIKKALDTLYVERTERAALSTLSEARANTEQSSLFDIRDKFFEDVASALVQIGQKWLSLSAIQQGLSER